MGITERIDERTRMALTATLHCFTGCALGEIAGLAIASAAGWGNAATIVVSVALAFTFGYALTMRGLVAHGMGVREALRLALAADTVSVLTMELTDTALILVIPGAMSATLGEALFWWSTALSLALAFVVALPVNRLLIARGRGHAVMHAHHGH